MCTTFRNTLTCTFTCVWVNIVVVTCVFDTYWLFYTHDPQCGNKQDSHHTSHMCVMKITLNSGEQWSFVWLFLCSQDSLPAAADLVWGAAVMAGRGRGRRMMSFSVDAVGINRGDSLPPTIQQPTPAFPVKHRDQGPVLWSTFNISRICLSSWT